MLLELLVMGGVSYTSAAIYQKRQRAKNLSSFLQLGITSDRAKAYPSRSGSNRTSRREQLRDISSSLDHFAKKSGEKAVNRNLAIASVSLGFAAIGALGFPVFSLLSLPGYVYITQRIFVSSYRSLITQGKMTVDTLSLIVRVVLLVQGYFFLGSLTSFSYTLSRKLLSSVKDNTRNTMIDVFRQQPQSAWVLVDGVEVETPSDALEPGDLVVVHAGETVPVDGVITAGIASVDQHILTGEAQPVEKETGDAVLALTLIVSGCLCIRVEKKGEDTAAAQIGDLLHRTVDGKTDLQFWVESISDRTVLPTLLLGMGALPFVGYTGTAAVLYAHPKYKTTIAGSLDIMHYLNLSSRQGILIKDGRTFERLNQVDTVVFDKTGTLTEEHPHVGQIHACNNYTPADILRYAAAAEAKQSHPIARAILQAAEERDVDVPALDDAAYHIGYGLTVTVNDRPIRVGSARFIEREGLTIPASLEARQAACHNYGHSLVLVAIDDDVVGAIELHVTVRPEAKAIIDGLRERGITSTYIISGDHELPTKKVAEDLGVDNYFAETLPAQKANLIEQLQASGKSVCYVGDGINDAIALKQATVSVSLRGASYVATDTAHVILMDETLRHLCDLFDISRDYRAHVKKTFLFVLIPHAIAMGGALFLQADFLTSFLWTQIGVVAGISHALFPSRRDANGASIRIGESTAEVAKSEKSWLNTKRESELASTSGAGTNGITSNSHTEGASTGSRLPLSPRFNAVAVAASPRP